jgi:hypothetical protein
VSGLDEPIADTRERPIFFALLRHSSLTRAQGVGSCAKRILRAVRPTRARSKNAQPDSQDVLWSVPLACGRSSSLRSGWRRRATKRLTLEEEWR